MQRVLRYRLLAALLASLALMAVTIPVSVGVASAAPALTCPPPCEECTPPPPKCVQPIAPCPEGNDSCEQVTSGSGSAATLFANDGTGEFGAAFGTFVFAEGCGDTGPADPDGVLNFIYSGGNGGSKTIVLALRSDRVTKGIGLYKICWRSDHPFIQLDGTLTQGGPPFTGYLPKCKNSDAGPCVLFKTSGQYNVAFFGILAPPGDPLVYPF